MKILIDIGHPAHVHLFHNLIKQLEKDGHELFITARDKEVAYRLLEQYQINYKIRPSSSSGLLNKAVGLFRITFYLWKYSKKFKPDILIGGVGNAYIALLGFITSKPSIIFDDTEQSKYELFLVRLFASNIVCPDSYFKELGVKQVRYNGFHELAYLHPKRFNSNVEVLKELGLAIDINYFFIRFVSWNASHDIGENGFTYDEKIAIVDFLKTQGRVLISSEKELPPELLQYKFTLHPSKVHDVMSSATLFIGEGATMASECAVLGTPSIYVNSIEAGTIKKQESYGLVFHFKNGKDVLKKVKELIGDSNLRLKMEEARATLLQENIDVTAFMVWFVENYPKSAAIMKENPNYQFNFK